jgi:hypothetical protein
VISIAERGAGIFAGEPVSRPAFSRAKTSRQDSRLADMHVGPTWLGLNE